MTFPEVHLWQVLRARLGGLKFRRQHPAGSYVLDFYCDTVRLAVEVDGETHARSRGEDAERDAEVFARLGVTTLRFTANDVTQNTEGVVRAILTAARRDVCSPFIRPQAPVVTHAERASEK